MPITEPGPKGDFLHRIVAHKNQEVALARQHITESKLARSARKSRKKRPFFDMLRTAKLNEPRIISEIKRASPSRGPLRDNLDPEHYAREYEKGGAVALSVLTDRHFFQGSPDDLQRARAACHLPVLRKDFIISAYQIYESACLGADAILLIVRILSSSQLRDYLRISRDLDMDALVEVHDAAEFEKASAAGARLIGINNRNLDTFETDIKTSVCLSSKLDAHQTAVAESGIRTISDIDRLMRAGISCFLIGESLVTADDPCTALKTFRGKKRLK